MPILTSYSDLLPLIAPEVPVCPDNFIIQAITKTARKFCQDTDGYRRWLASISLVALQGDYVLSAPTDTEIRHIICVMWNTTAGIAAGNTGIPLKPNVYVYYPEASTRLGYAVAAHTLSFNQNHIPQYSVTNGMDVSVSLVPVFNSASSLDLNFLERWHEAIVGGALASLLTMKKRKWSDPQRALDFQKDYFKGINRLRRENIADYKHEVPCLEA